jgi:hypothetical protein
MAETGRNWPRVRAVSPAPHGRSTRIYIDDVEQPHLTGAQFSLRVDDVNRMTLTGFVEAAEVEAQGVITHVARSGDREGVGSTFREALLALAEEFDG